MKRENVLNYMRNIKKEDIISFSKKENIDIDSNDLEIIYEYVKNRGSDLLDNPLDIFSEVKDKISNNVYDKLLLLYNNYKFIIDKIK